MEYDIRPLTVSDAKKLSDLINRIRDEGKYLFNSRKFSLEQTEGYVASHDESGNPIIGAFLRDGSLIGWIDFNVGSFDEIKHVGTLGMGVAAEYRSLGIGTKLLSECIGQAKSTGLEKLELGVFSSNLVAQKLYAKFGFFVEGRLLKKRKFQGSYDDLVCMGLFL